MEEKQLKKVRALGEMKGSGEMEQKKGYGGETGWDLTLCSVLVPGQMSSWATKYKEKFHGTKSSCLHAQLGQIVDKKDTKRPKTQLPLLKSQEQKQGTTHPLCIQQHQGGGQTR